MKGGQTYNELDQPKGFDFSLRKEIASDGHVALFPPEGRCRVVIENVNPMVDGGRYPIKRTAGERLVVEADLFADSHVLLTAVVRYRPDNRGEWAEAPMVRIANDRWRGEFTVDKVGVFFYSIEAWVDRFKSWREDTRKKSAAGQDIAVDLLAGSKLIENAARRAGGETGARLRQWADELISDKGTAAQTGAAELAVDENLGNLVIRHAERSFATSCSSLRVTVDPVRARFSTWYEMFPRSFSPESGCHGTF